MISSSFHEVIPDPLLQWKTNHTAILKEEAFTTFDVTLVVPLGKLEPLSTRIASTYRREFPVLHGGDQKS